MFVFSRPSRNLLGLFAFGLGYVRARGIMPHPYFPQASMLTVIDTRPSFLSPEGLPLAGGQLTAFLFGTTTYADIFQDAGLTLPLPNPLPLSGAGWPSNQIYAGAAVQVLVQAFEGLDEYGENIWSTVKVFEVASGAAPVPAGAGEGEAPTVEALRAISGMADGDLVHVLGYYAAGDCYVRDYLWSETSMAVDTGGTVVSSNTVPAGRWLLQHSGPLGVSTFGVLPGDQPINSQLRAAAVWASSNGASLHIPAGTYNLTQAGTLTVGCPMTFDAGVKFVNGAGDQPEDTWFTLRLTQPCALPSGLAGSNVRLITQWDSSRPTLAPMTAWDPVAKGFEESTGLSIHLDNGSTAYDWTAAPAGTTIGAITAAPGSHSILGTAAVTVGRITEGPGQITYLNQEPFTTKALRTSCLAGTVSKSMAVCTELVTVDTTLSLLSGTTVPAIVHVVPGGTLGFGSGCRIDRGVVGYPGCITGSKGFASDIDVAIEMYSDPNAAMDSWNRSSASNSLDLKSRTVTRAPAKNGRISNGVIQADVTAELILDNVTFVGSYDGPSLRATNCHLEHKTTKPIGAGTHSTLTDCSIKTIYYLIIDPDVQTKWTRVAVSGRVVKKGKGGVWRDVSLNQIVAFVPDTDGHCGNFSWVGGAATSIRLDASQRLTEGACILFNFEIRGLIGLAYGIQAMELNTTAKYWAPEGHFNVRIGDNEGGPSTYGCAVGTQISGGSSSITIGGDPSQILWLTNNHSYDQVRALGRVTNINATAPASGAPAWSGEGGFVCYPPGVPFIDGSRTRGDVVDNSRCTYNFEVYHRTLA